MSYEVDIANPIRTLDSIFSTPDLVNLINSQYFPVENMKQSSDKLRKALSSGFRDSSSQDTDESWVKKIKWGKYEQQYLLKEQNKWPAHTWLQWPGSVAQARADMRQVLNREKVHCGAADRPETRCDLLDALIQRCFSECAASQKSPGIPIVTAIRTKTTRDCKPELTDFEFQWVSLQSEERPDLLFFRMLCRHDFSKSPR